MNYVPEQLKTIVVAQTDVKNKANRREQKLGGIFQRL